MNKHPNTFTVLCLCGLNRLALPTGVIVCPTCDHATVVPNIGKASSIPPGTGRQWTVPPA